MATTKQNQMIAGRMVEFQDKFSTLPKDDGQWIIQNTGEAIDLFINAVINRAKTVAQTIITIFGEIIATVTVPVTTDKFVAKDNFKVDTGCKAKVKISYLSDNFKSRFLGKKEEPFFGSILYGRQLKRNSVDGPILSELGGQGKAETTLTEIYAIMAAQSNGEVGNLLNNGWANIFYVGDVNKALCAVVVSWHGGGWRVDAYSVGAPDKWVDGYRVFSRNLSLVSQTN